MRAANSKKLWGRGLSKEGGADAVGTNYKKTLRGDYGDKGAGEWG